MDDYPLSRACHDAHVLADIRFNIKKLAMERALEILAIHPDRPQNLTLEVLSQKLDLPKIIVEEMERVWYKQMSGTKLEQPEQELFETIEDYITLQVM